jgi:hypothetical protein
MARKSKTPKPQEPTRAEKKALAIRVIKEQEQQGFLHFFHDAMRAAYATVPSLKGGLHRETWRVQSDDFNFWVMNVLVDKIGMAPKFLVREIVEEFEVHAICKGDVHEVYIRIAEQGAISYIDLCNDQWQVLEISASGWKVLDESPVKFIRATGMTSLPIPKAGGTLRDVVRFLNVSPKNEVLLLTWLTYALRCGASYPVLSLKGVQGSGKSTITKIMRALIDPSVAALTAIPKSNRDMAIHAANSHLVAMDNLSEISASLSDTMCCLATGGAYRNRTLFKDRRETILTYRCPLIVNGISELPNRPDLLDRSVIIEAAPINAKNRRDERRFWSEFESVRPQLFGAMLDVIQAGIRNLDDVRLDNPPRMADFARWGIATEQAAGYPAGTFMAAYGANREDANAAAIESSPIAQLLYHFLCSSKQKHGDGVPRFEFHGTAVKLLSELRSFAESGSGIQDTHPEFKEFLRHPNFPKTPSAMSAELTRVEPNLKTLNIAVEKGRTHVSRYIRLALERGAEVEAKRDTRVGGVDAQATTDAPEVAVNASA